MPVSRKTRNLLPFILLAVMTAQVDAVTIGRGPYLQMTGPDRTVIRWRTDAATHSVVHYGTTFGALDQVAGVAGPTTEHLVELNGLEPDTTYYYDVGSFNEVLAGGDADHAFTTHPVPGDLRPGGVTLWVTGDQGFNTGIVGRVRDKAMQTADQVGWSIDAWLTLGDNAYGHGPGAEENTDGAYQIAMFEPFAEIMRQTSVYPCVGNHDLAGAQGGSVHDEVFTLPQVGELGGFPSFTERWYSQDIGNVHIVTLEWDFHLLPDDLMTVWLISDLAINVQPWTILIVHGPLHCRGSYDSDTAPFLIDYRETLTPICASFDVDLVLGGHSHSYERSGLIDSNFDGNSFEFDPAVHEIDGGNGQPPWSGNPEGDGAYWKYTENGVVYAVIGNASKGGNSIANPHPVVKYWRTGNGSALINAECEKLEFLYVDQYQGITDSFTLRKPGACTPASCVSGNVPSGQPGVTYPMLRVNGSTGNQLGELAVDAGVPLELSFSHLFELEVDILEVFGHVGAATADDAIFLDGWGEMCFAPRLLAPGNPALFSARIMSTTTSPIAIPFAHTFTLPSHLAGRTVDIQGVIAAGPKQFVTNRIRLRVAQ